MEQRGELFFFNMEKQKQSQRRYVTTWTNHSKIDTPFARIKNDITISPQERSKDHILFFKKENLQRHFLVSNDFTFHARMISLIENAELIPISIWHINVLLALFVLHNGLVKQSAEGTQIETLQNCSICHNYVLPQTQLRIHFDEGIM